MTWKNRTLSPVVQLFIEHLRAVAKSMFAPAKVRKGWCIRTYDLITEKFKI
jgi:hypothetical protein